MALHLLSTITLWKKWNFPSYSVAEATATWRCGNGYFHEANVIVETLHQRDHQNLQILWDEALVESQLLLSYSGTSFPQIFTLEIVSCLSAPLPPSLNWKFLKARAHRHMLPRVCNCILVGLCEFGVDSSILAWRIPWTEEPDRL